MKRILPLLLAGIMVLGLFGCSTESQNIASSSEQQAAEPAKTEELSEGDTQVASQDAIRTISGKVSEIEKYGHASLDITIEDFKNAGFELGDIVTVEMDNFSQDMPYLNGYYVDKGEYMLRAYPGSETLAVCINYGNFSDEANAQPGDDILITMKEEDGASTLQEVNNLVYSNNRDNFESDEEFANFRPVVLGNITDWKLFRSASPIDNKYCRAAIANMLAETVGVNTVMNLASTDEEILDALNQENFNSDYYKVLYDKGFVIPLGLPIAFEDDAFAQGIVRGLTFLSEHDTPYLVHCTEGKDRAGFACMVIEALMGATREEIIDDYMISYKNYYGIEPGTEKYDAIVQNNIIPMLSIISNDESSSENSLAEDTEAYLLKYGMAPEAIENLKAKLSA